MHSLMGSGEKSWAQLALAAGSGLVAGAVLGYTFAARVAARAERERAAQRASAAQAESRMLELSLGSLAAAAASRGGATDGGEAPVGPGSYSISPASTPRTLSRADEVSEVSDLAHPLSARHPSLVVLVRDDLALTSADLVEQSGRTVLGQFKKLYRRRDPALKAWEAGGSRVQVFAVHSEADIMLVQQAARSLAIPTHAFAGMRGQRTRSVMAIGPASSELLGQLTQHLRQL